MSGKDDFVVSKILGDKKTALLLIRNPNGNSEYHQCHPLSKIVGRDGGGQTIECVEGAVLIMSFADCALFALYAKPAQNQNRSLTVSPGGYKQYFRCTGEPRTSYQAVKADAPISLKFAGGSNR